LPLFIHWNGACTSVRMPQLTEELAHRTAESFAAGDVVKGNESRIAAGLGWFSLGVGAAELLFARRIARFLGLRGSDTMLRLYGLREIGSGIGILASPSNPAPWLWVRAAGDVMDLAALGNALGQRGNKRGRTIAAIANVAAAAALDTLCAQRLSARRISAYPARVHVEESIAIDRSREEVYRFWSDLQNLPRVMKNLERIESAGEGAAHWVLRTPLGRRIEWDAVIDGERPGEFIAWRTTGGDIEGRNSIRFEPAFQGRGTLVKIDLRFNPPAFAPPAVVRFFCTQHVRDNLRRLKQLLETGSL